MIVLTTKEYIVHNEPYNEICWQLLAFYGKFVKSSSLFLEGSSMVAVKPLHGKSNYEIGIYMNDIAIPIKSKTTTVYLILDLNI